MRRALAYAGLMIASICAVQSRGDAQDLVIANVRVIDGTGAVAPRGAIVVRHGHIASVGVQVPRADAALPMIDGRGMSALPALIDAHRHLVKSNGSSWLANGAGEDMANFLRAGFTTIYSMGDDPATILELKHRLEAGQLPGPRLFAVLVVPLSRAGASAAAAGPSVDAARAGRWKPPLRPTRAPDAIPEEELRAAVRSAKERGFDAIKTYLLVTPGGPEVAALKTIADEARTQGMLTFTHATTVEDALAAVDAHTGVLAHTPHTGRLDEDPAAVQRIATAGIPMVSTLGVFIPHFDAAGAADFRDGLSFPWQHLSSGGQGPVNARLLWNAGISYAYGTDTSWKATDSLDQELRALALIFSPAEIIRIMTVNTAKAIGKGDELGSITPGKRADIILVNDDPLADIRNILKVRMVVKDGVVVVRDRRLVGDAAASRSEASRRKRAG